MLLFWWQCVLAFNYVTNEKWLAAIFDLSCVKLHRPAFLIGLLRIIVSSAQRWQQMRCPAGPSDPVKEVPRVSEPVRGGTVIISGVIPVTPKVIQASYQKLEKWTAMRPTRAPGYKSVTRFLPDTSMWNFARPDRKVAPATLYWDFCAFSRNEGIEALVKLID